MISMTRREFLSRSVDGAQQASLLALLTSIGTVCTFACTVEEGGGSGEGRHCHSGLECCSGEQIILSGACSGFWSGLEVTQHPVWSLRSQFEVAQNRMESVISSLVRSA